jgi:hypothetical protein
MTSLPGLADQHQRGRMVHAILADLRAVVARLFPSGVPLAGSPAVSMPLGAAGASDFAPFHTSEVIDV